MKVKMLLRFYHSADRLEKSLDRILFRHALRPTNTLVDIEKICQVMEMKDELSRLWAYLDGIMSVLTRQERMMLKIYAKCRSSNALLCLPSEVQRQLHTCVGKFRRRCTGVQKYAHALIVLKEFNNTY